MTGQIHRDRAVSADALIRAARLGEFRYGPNDSPWYGASFSTTEEGKAAHELAKKLNRAELPRLIDRANALIGQTRMRPFASIAELGVYLRLLLDIRETLDKFTPSVFDRSLTIERADGSEQREFSGFEEFADFIQGTAGIGLEPHALGEAWRKIAPAS